MISASVHPEQGEAGQYGTWTVRLVVDQPLAAGASIRIQLPRSWHTTALNQAKGMHSIDPTRPGYVAVRCDSRDARVGWRIEGGTTAEYTGVNTRTGLDGRPHRYNYVIRIEVLEGRLATGTPVDIIVGDRSGGSPGFAAGVVAGGPEPVLVAMDTDGSGRYTMLSRDHTPTLRIVPGPITELAVVTRSEAAVGETITVTAVGLDRFQNAVPPPMPVSLHLLTGSADIDEEPEPDGVAQRWRVTARYPGILRIEARTGRIHGRANPVVCTVDPPAVRTYWGDLHSHAEHSYDAVGHSPYAYARDVSALDFYALTEHTETWDENGAARWTELIRAAEEHHEPGRFVTLHAYEATLDAPYGHHNVYYRHAPTDAWPVVGRDRQGTLDALWSRLTEGDALTVPHHTGIAWPQRSDLDRRRGAPVIDWSIRHDVFRALVEVYSSHGQSETYNPHHPAAYERMSDWSLSSYSVPGPHYATDGWLTGQRMGSVAGSDNHTGQPGKTHAGLTAAITPELTREAIFGAMQARSVYATTGERLILRVTVDGQPMGATVHHGGPHEIRVDVIGTDDIESVVLLRGDLDRRIVERATEWNPHSDTISSAWVDKHAPSHGFYYIRVRQQHPHRGRDVLAWSSPIWIDATRPEPEG